MATSTAPPVAYRPIPIQTLRVSPGPDCRFFLMHRDEHGERFVLFRGPAQAWESTHRDRLIGNGVTELFVRDTDYGQYTRYVEGHLGDVLSDPTLSDGLKGELLFDVSRELLDEGFQDPSAPEFVDRVSAVSSQMVAFASKGHEPLAHLVKALDTTYDLRGHSTSVCVYSLTIALEARIFSQRQLRDLAMGALLHDIGKTRLRAELLARPDALTIDEVVEVRRHVEIGERLVLEAHDDVRPAVLQPISLHHEALNGSGYPRQLTGDRISPAGRIVAIANAFDALTSTRPYRARVNAFEALSLMKIERAARYDQDLIACFIRRLAHLSRR